MTDPNILAIFSVVFILLGLYNINSGIRRVREGQQRGQDIRWYKQVNLLTGIEYILLSLVFLLSLSIRNNMLPASFQGIIIPFYLLVLLSSAVLAGFVIRQAFRNARQRQSAARRNSTSIASNTAGVDMMETPEQLAINAQRRRERRQKAAAARRRRAGKA